MINKEIPHNLEAEQSVLGAMFLSKYALQKAADALTKDAFYSNANSEISLWFSFILLMVSKPSSP